MLEISKFSYGKGDFLYEIEYLDGVKKTSSAVKRVISSNEEAKDSLKNRMSDLINAVRKYLQIGDKWHITFNSIKFMGKGDFSINLLVDLPHSFPPIEYKCRTKIEHIEDFQKDIAEGRSAALDFAGQLKEELNAYVKGDKLQQELPLNNNE